ncbi:MAG: hypothetical protein ACRDOB_02910, partial [Streptosporangiaceae bacterium]
MLPNDRAQPAAQDKPTWPARIMRWFGKAPLLIKIVMAAAALCLWPFILPFTLLTSAVAVIQRRPGRAAAYATATWVFPVWVAFHVFRVWTIPLAILPFAVAWAASTSRLARSYVPCRTTGWAMLWSLPTGFVLLRYWPHQPLIGVIAALLVALAILGWRLAKDVQDVRMYGPDGAAQARKLGPLAGPAGAPIPPSQHPGGRFAGAGHSGGHGGVRAHGAQAAALPYAE